GRWGYFTPLSRFCISPFTRSKSEISRVGRNKPTYATNPTLTHRNNHPPSDAALRISQPLLDTKPADRLAFMPAKPVPQLDAVDRAALARGEIKGFAKIRIAKRKG